MKVPCTKSGKCGNMVWQRNRYGQICYPAFIPFNPCTQPQVAVRRTFGATSKRWGTLTQAQRDIWNAVARTKWSRPRLGRGRLPGYNFFMQTNVPLAHRGKAQFDLPPEYSQFVQQASWRLYYISRFDQPPVGPTPFFQANQLIHGCPHDPRKSPARLPAPT